MILMVQLKVPTCTSKIRYFQIEGWAIAFLQAQRPIKTSKWSNFQSPTNL